MPLMAIMAITQDGGGTSKEYVTCYSCGDKGHYAGNEECTKHGCIAPSAPDRYRGSGTKGKCKGGPRSGKGRGKGKGKGKETASPMAQSRSPAGISIPMAPVVKETTASSHTRVHSAQTKSLQRRSNPFLTRSPIR